MALQLTLSCAYTGSKANTHHIAVGVDVDIYNGVGKEMSVCAFPLCLKNSVISKSIVSQ